MPVCHDDPLEILGDRLLDLRLAEGLTQADLAAQLPVGGHSTIAGYEAAVHIPKPEVIKKYEAFFELETGDLMTLRRAAYRYQRTHPPDGVLAEDLGEATPQPGDASTAGTSGNEPTAAGAGARSARRRETAPPPAQSSTPAGDAERERARRPRRFAFAAAIAAVAIAVAAAAASSERSGRDASD